MRACPQWDIDLASASRGALPDALRWRSTPTAPNLLCNRCIFGKECRARPTLAITILPRMSPDLGRPSFCRVMHLKGCFSRRHLPAAS